MPLAVRAAASARPSSPQGRTISTIAITRKTRTIEIFGKTRMPKALSSDTMIAARKVPGTLPRPPITTTTSASVITCKSIVWFAASRGNSSAPPSAGEKDAEREDAGEQPFLVDAERRHHLAILRRRAHQHAPGRAAEEQPDERENERSEGDQQQVVSREGLAEEVDRALEARRARTEQLARPPDQQHEILDDERDAEGREQLKQFRRVVDAAQQHHFDQRADRGDDERGEHDRAPEADARRSAGRSACTRYRRPACRRRHARN